MLEAVTLGIGLGLAAGLAPGPLLGLLVVASLRGGFAAGSRVALVPLLSDLPTVALSLTLVSGLPRAAVQAMSVVGGLVVVWFGVQAVREARAGLPDVEPAGRSLWRGVAMNVVSPHPWLFWIGVGAPVTVTAWHRGAAGAVAFVVVFYGLLVGAKLVIAAVIGASRHRFGPRVHRVLGTTAGVLMVASAVVLVVSALG